jgi:hypothetical protein
VRWQFNTACFVITAVLFFAKSAFGFSYSDSAWFLDSSKTINYCIDRDSKFSLSEAELRSKLDWAFAQWIEYIDEQENLKARPLSLQLARQVQWVENCDNADLRFLFGLENETISQYKKQDFFHPVSFARRTQYNSRLGWGKGIVWVANDDEFRDLATDGKSISWTNSLKIKAILLHELGHVFGVGHSDGTIMRANIVESLVGSADAYSLTHITNIWELISPPQTIWTSGNQYHQVGIITAATFLNLIGRSPQGQVSSQWIADQNKILIQDSLGQYILKVSFKFERQAPEQNVARFYAYRKNEDNQIITVNENRDVFIKIGKLSTVTGGDVNIIVEKNLNDRHLSFLYQPTSDGNYQGLFIQPCSIVNVPLRGDVCLPDYPKDER